MAGTGAQPSAASRYMLYRRRSRQRARAVRRGAHRASGGAAGACPRGRCAAVLALCRTHLSTLSADTDSHLKRTAVLLNEVPSHHFEQARFRHRSSSLRPGTPDYTPIERGRPTPSPHTPHDSARRQRELLPRRRGTPDSARHRQDRPRDTSDSARPHRRQSPLYQANAPSDLGRRERAVSQRVTPPRETAASLCADTQRLTRNTALPNAMK